MQNSTDKPKLFQYAIIWHPTEKQIKDDGAKSKVILEPKMGLFKDAASCGIAAAMEIPAAHKNELDQIEIAVRPF